MILLIVANDTKVTLKFKNDNLKSIEKKFPSFLSPHAVKKIFFGVAGIQ